MFTKLIATLAGITAAALIAAPAASAEITLRNVDVAGIEIPIPSWSSGTVPPGTYKTGYNISPRYEFTTDPTTGERRAKYDTGCHHC